MVRNSSLRRKKSRLRKKNLVRSRLVSFPPRIRSRNGSIRSDQFANCRFRVARATPAWKVWTARIIRREATGARRTSNDHPERWAGIARCALFRETVTAVWPPSWNPARSPGAPPTSNSPPRGRSSATRHRRSGYPAALRWLPRPRRRARSNVIARAAASPSTTICSTPCSTTRSCAISSWIWIAISRWTVLGTTRSPSKLGIIIR